MRANLTALAIGTALLGLALSACQSGGMPPIQNAPMESKPSTAHTPCPEPHFYVDPNYAVIKPHQVLNLQAILQFWFYKYGRCLGDAQAEKAQWSSNGGHLQLMPSGDTVEFWAHKKMTYSLQAVWNSDTATATVVVKD